MKTLTFRSSLILIWCTLLAVWTPLYPVHAENLSITTHARAAALIDVESGRILYSSRGDEPMLIASLTKIMTAIVAIENGDLDSKVKVGKNAFAKEGSSLYLKHGEEMKLEDMLYGLMLRSGNDAATAIAEHVGGSEQGFVYLMSELPQERLSIAIGAQASAQRAYDETVAFVRERKAFGKPVIDFQNTRFTLADLKSKLQVGWAHLDWAIARHLRKELTAEEGAAAKLWHTEFQWEVMDKCLQLHGGAGYMNEYPIAKMWRGARVTRIFGGTNEIMKELIGRKL